MNIIIDTYFGILFFLSFLFLTYVAAGGIYTAPGFSASFFKNFPLCVRLCVCVWGTTSLIDCAADLKGQRTAGEVTNKSFGLFFLFYFFIWVQIATTVRLWDVGGGGVVGRGADCVTYTTRTKNLGKRDASIKQNRQTTKSAIGDVGTGNGN